MTAGAPNLADARQPADTPSAANAPQATGTSPRQRVAVIIGAGPAGLTAALELLRRTDIKPIVLEASGSIGGLARTVQYRGNRMDLGGHRFFSKSERVNRWWLAEMPLVAPAEGLCTGVAATETPSATGLPTAISPAPPPQEAHGADHVMLLRPRRSRIYFLRQFFAYPLSFSRETLHKLGFRRTVAIVGSYLAQRLRPQRPAHTLEEFFIQRFGRELYRTFFQQYTEKVWGVACRELPAKWGAQRIRGMSLWRAVQHQWAQRFAPRGRLRTPGETTLCEQFLYPKLGPGQLWEHVAEKVMALGGEVRLHTAADGLVLHESRVNRVETCTGSGERQSIDADFVFSTMPVPALLRSMGGAVPPAVCAAAEGLQFRDFLTVGLVAKRLAVAQPDGSPLNDTWIYIQEPGIRMGRVQIFNNWSPALVADAATVSLGLEYFCTEGDDLWQMPDDTLQRFAADELERMGLLHAADVVDGHVERVPRAYPAYLGTYDDFDRIRTFTDGIGNLFLIGRNGMHRYNNQDHSMLAAMTAVDQVASGVVDREALWAINTEQEYHEARS